MSMRLINPQTKRMIELRMGCGERLSLFQTQALDSWSLVRKEMRRLPKRVDTTDPKR